MNLIIEDGILQNAENILPGENEIVIPAGVTEISPYCFVNNDIIHRINLPEGLLKIGEGAFWGCQNLEWINLPSSIFEIGDYAFAETAITSITIPGNLSVMPNNDLFLQCTRLRTVELNPGVGAIYDYAFSDLPNLETVSFPDGLVYIGDHAFENCPSLKEIRIPDTVRYIGEGAFDWCTSLMDPPKPFGEPFNPYLYLSKDYHVTLEPARWKYSYHFGIDSNTLDGNSYVTSITLNGDVARKAILNCPNLETVYVHSSAYFMSEAFYNCPKLKYVVVPQPKGEWHWPHDYPQNFEGQKVYGTEFDYDAFGYDESGKRIEPIFCPEYPWKQEYSVDSKLYKAFPDTEEYILPEHIRRIEESAFKWCDSIRSITLHGQVELIGDCAFANLENLETLKLESGIQKIGNSPNEPMDVYRWRLASELPYSNNAFFGCKKLITVEFPDTLTHICNYAFSECISLEKIRLPEKLTRLYIGVFQGCTALKEVIFPKRLNRIGVGAFRGCTSLSNIQIPDSVVHIQGDAFAGCSGLSRIQLPECLQALEKGAFSDCKNLIEIQPPSSIRWRYKNINGLLYDRGALHTCPAGLEEAVIEPGTHRIFSHAFDGCRKLRSIVIPETVVEIEEFAFWHCDALEEVILLNPNTNYSFLSFCDCPKLDLPIPSNH